MSGSEPIIREYPLGGGITARVSDDTRHYFGGYYQVRILVSADVPLAPAWFATTGDYEDALRRLGERVRFTRTLEKMAVPEVEVAEVRQSLMESFDTNMLPYLSRPDFAERFVRSEYARSLKSSAAGYR